MFYRHMPLFKFNKAYFANFSSIFILGVCSVVRDVYVGGKYAKTEGEEVSF